VKASFRLGRLFGIEIGVHFTWLIAFGLISWSLAQGFFPHYFPGWSGPTYWATGILAALLLFVSVLVHEMAHSLVAVAKGLPARGITLFIFGGVSNIGAEAVRARDELQVAAVGPLTSLGLAALFWGLLQVAPGEGRPLNGVLGYLALVNGLLAGFNMLPGIPLDGGRVLRSILWGATGSLSRATNVAASVGQGLGWAMVGLGVFLFLSGERLSGIWVAVLGWFLGSSAGAFRRETAMVDAFREVSVRQVMDSQPAVIDPDASVDTLVREWVFGSHRRAVPVCRGTQLLGIVTVADAWAVPQDRWPTTRVAEVMVREPIHSVSPGADLSETLRLLAEHELNQVVVLRNGELVGMVSRADIMRYLQSRQEMGMRPPGRER
jgi:Zn-dependent protease/CBS domain-containing protein